MTTFKASCYKIVEELECFSRRSIGKGAGSILTRVLSPSIRTNMNGEASCECIRRSHKALRSISTHRCVFHRFQMLRESSGLVRGNVSSMLQILDLFSQRLVLTDRTRQPFKHLLAACQLKSPRITWLVRLRPYLEQVMPVIVGPLQCLPLRLQHIHWDIRFRGIFDHVDGLCNAYLC